MSVCWCGSERTLVSTHTYTGLYARPTKDKQIIVALTQPSIYRWVHVWKPKQPGTNRSPWIKWMDKQTDGSHYSVAHRWFLVFAMVRQTTVWSIRKSYRLNGFICWVNIYSHLMQRCSLQNVTADWLQRWWWRSAFSLLLCAVPWKDDSYVIMAKVWERVSDYFQSHFRHLLEEQDYGGASARPWKIPLASGYSATQGTIVSHGLQQCVRIIIWWFSRKDR